jgi:hypothetical protein
MRNYATWLRRAALTVIAVTSLATPTMSIARANQPTEQTHVARPHPQKHEASIEHRETAQTWEAQRCTRPYRNQFPPCMSTWPAGDPNYHGSRPGPTFE